MRKEVSLIVIIFLLLTSLQNISRLSDFYSSSISAARDAVAFLKEQPKKDIYVDPSSYGMFRYYFGFTEDYKLKPAYYDYIGDIKDAYVVDGGSRGAFLYYTVVKNAHDNLTSRLPAGWIIIKTIGNPFRKYENNSLDMTIYYAPQEGIFKSF